MTWADRAETFAKQRAQLRQVLASTLDKMDIGQIATEFKFRFNYLPKDLCRRLRELVQTGDIQRHDGSVPTYEFVRGSHDST